MAMYMMKQMNPLLMQQCFNLVQAKRKKQIELGLEIFNYVPDKDVFIDIYSNLLANRILSLFNKNNTSNQINYFDLDQIRIML